MATEHTPEYYIGKTFGIEAMDVVIDFQHDNYNIGTALTYLMRAGKKPNNPMKQDLIKAIEHLKAEIRRIDLQEEDRLDLKDWQNEIIDHLPEYTRSTT